MYPKLPLKYIGITDTFGLRINPITGVSAFHYGLDLGWNKYQGEPVLASYDARVVEEGYNSALGNYIVLRYKIENKTIINRYLHLKNRALVKRGSNVKQGQIIGYMGETGSAQGVHLHFEYWICPNVYTYRSSDNSRYAVDPLKHCYLFEDQEVGSSSSLKVKRVVGSPVSRNRNRSQIRVVGRYLNCRSTPSLNGRVLGYIKLGYYNVLDTKTNNGYVWYKIAPNRWVAYLRSVVVRYLVTSKPTVNNNVSNNSASTSTSNSVLNNNSSSNNQAVLEDAKSEETVENIGSSSDLEDDIVSSNMIDFDNYNKFESPKDDYYYIYLKEGETIYFPK